MQPSPDAWGLLSMPPTQKMDPTQIFKAEIHSDSKTLSCYHLSGLLKGRVIPGTSSWTLKLKPFCWSTFGAKFNTWLDLAQCIIGGSLRYERPGECAGPSCYSQIQLAKVSKITNCWCQITSMAVVKSVLEKHRKLLCGGRFVPLPKTLVQLETQVVLVCLFFGG